MWGAGDTKCVVHGGAARGALQAAAFSLQFTGHWTLDTGHWTLDTGHWTLDTRHWTLDTGHWTMDNRHWTLDSGQWTMDNGQWTLDTGHWTLDRTCTEDTGHFNVLYTVYYTIYSEHCISVQLILQSVNCNTVFKSKKFKNIMIQANALMESLQ